MQEFYTDYETEPIGGGNPYYRCIHCKDVRPTNQRCIGWA